MYMKIKLNDNIRKYRKQKDMTQEQFAEAMGVSIGAVSKWENAQMNPEISMIVKIADFFELSVDALLGYECVSNNLLESVARIKELTNKKAYEKAREEVMKALVKYPNNFAVVYQSGLLFYKIGLEQKDMDSFDHSIRLLEHACSLLDQNENPDINLGTIKNSIAMILGSQHRYEEAIDMLKEYNISGVNNVRIGNLHAAMEKYDLAMPILSDGFVDNIVNMYLCVAGLLNCLMSTKRFDEAKERILWLQSVLKSLKHEGKTSYLTKMEVSLDVGLIMIYFNQKDEVSAHSLMKDVARTAIAFDRAPDFSSYGIKFYCGKTRCFSDDMGSTVTESVQNILSMNDDAGESQELIKMWKEVLDEAKG